MATATSALRTVLKLGMGPGGNLSSGLFALGHYTVQAADDARAICDAIREYANRVPQCESECSCSPLHPLASLVQEADSDAVYEIFEADALPTLLKIFDQRLPTATEDDAEDLVFVLKIFVMYAYAPGIERIPVALKQLENDLFVWGVLFDSITEEHPLRLRIHEMLNGELPRGFAGVAYLDFVTRLGERGEIAVHAFETPAGLARLKEWASNEETLEASFPQSVARALPHLKSPERFVILDRLLEHEDTSVQVEAAAVAVKLGRAEGLDVLAELCRDCAISHTARLHLEALGQAAKIPAEAQDPTFRAMAEMCAWLDQAEAYGEVPDEIEVVDTRKIFWPPANEERTLWLIRYTYEAMEDDDEDEADVGIGLIGSDHPGCLFGETDPSQSPEDIYALHCCWELELEGDERAPDVRSVSAGRALLGL